MEFHLFKKLDENPTKNGEIDSNPLRGHGEDPPSGGLRNLEKVCGGDGYMC